MCVNCVFNVALSDLRFKKNLILYSTITIYKKIYQLKYAEFRQYILPIKIPRFSKHSMIKTLTVIRYGDTEHFNVTILICVLAESVFIRN